MRLTLKLYTLNHGLFDTSKTVKDELTSQIAVIGENTNIRRFKKIVSDGVVVSYIHAGERLVLVEADAQANETVEASMKTITADRKIYESTVY